MRRNAAMSRPAKRTRTTSAKTSATDITIRPITREKNGSVWVTHLVQGWQEDGKWKRKQFFERADAERFAALKRVELENKGRAQQMILSILTQEQHDNAVSALAKVGETYSLADAVDYFLKHHRPPKFTIRLAEAIKHYIDDKERDGLRDRTVQSIKWSLNVFCKAIDDPYVHEVTPAQVESHLRGLRAKDGISTATRRSWEIHRGALSGFFAWSASRDVASNRPFTFSNPVESVRKFSARQVREGQKSKIDTTLPADVLHIFSVLMRWRGGVMVRSFAYLYFLGLRPIELSRLHGREEELVNLKTMTVTIPSAVSKTRYDRQVKIPENLAAWFAAAPGPIKPARFKDLCTMVRKHFKMTPDVARHSFISYHVALHRSIGDAALQAGNSESVVRKNYLNTHTREEGGQFFRIVPDRKRRRAVLAPEKKAHAKPHLKVV